MGRQEHQALRGQRIAVVGASSGIGLETSRVLDQAGAHVVAFARRFSGLSGQERRLDVCDSESVRAAIGSLEAMDAMVYCAGDGNFSQLREDDPERLLALTDVHAAGLLRCVQAALPIMSNNAYLVYMGSVAAREPLPDSGLYGAAKASASRMLKSLREETRGRLRICELVAGAVDTPLWPAEWDGMRSSMLESGAIANAIAGVLASEGANVEELVVRPSVGALGLNS